MMKSICRKSLSKCQNRCRYQAETMSFLVLNDVVSEWNRCRFQHADGTVLRAGVMILHADGTILHTGVNLK